MSWLVDTEVDLPVNEAIKVLDDWCRSRDGRTVTFSIDHGTQPVLYDVLLWDCGEQFSKPHEDFGTILNLAARATNGKMMDGWQ